MPGDIEMRIGQPLSPEGYTLKTRAAFTALMEERVRALMADPAA